MYYYKNDYEIDFITDDSLIQVCYELNEQNIEREVKALKKYKSNKKKYIITFNQFDEVGDIKVVPFWYFSLFYL